MPSGKINDFNLNGIFGMDTLKGCFAKDSSRLRQAQAGQRPSPGRLVKLADALNQGVKMGGIECARCQKGHGRKCVNEYPGCT